LSSSFVQWPFRMACKIKWGESDRLNFNWSEVQLEGRKSQLD
jgi:hypothetical protein